MTPRSRVFSRAGLEVDHERLMLRGERLDPLVLDIAGLAEQDTTRWLDVERILLMNKISLMAEGTADLSPLVAGMLLIAADYLDGGDDEEITLPEISDRLGDFDWMVSEIVRLRNDGFDAEVVTKQIAAIVQSLQEQ